MLDSDYGKERWKYIPGYEGYYMISDRGRVKSVDREITYQDGHTIFKKGKLINGTTDKLGYRYVHLSKDGIPGNYSIHRLVADAFVPHFKDGDIVNHKDENPSNNFYINLEWCTYGYNNQYNNLTKRRFETRSKHINDGSVKLGHPLVSLDNDFNYVKEYTNAEWTRSDGFNPSAVHGTALRKRSKTHKGLYWLYQDEYNDIVEVVSPDILAEYLKNYIRVGNVYERNSEKRNKIINDYLKEFAGEKDDG